MTDDDFRRAVIDPERSACLCDVGGTDIRASVCVGFDGHADFVLINAELLGDERHTYDPTTPQAPHEQVGSLPARWRDRVQLAPLRCGRRTQAGTACRIIVSQPGRTCAHHRTDGPPR